jgi:hypothetical protein
MANMLLNKIQSLSSNVYQMTYEMTAQECGNITLLEAMELGRDIMRVNHAIHKLTKTANSTQDRIDKR